MYIYTYYIQCMLFRRQTSVFRGWGGFDFFCVPGLMRLDVSRLPGSGKTGEEGDASWIPAFIPSFSHPPTYPM